MPTNIGETNLSVLLSTLQFTVHPDVFVFATTANDTSSFLPVLSKLPASVIQMYFREAEGTTVITTLDDLKKHCPDLDYQFPCRMITLQVHSSLEAIGFMAVIASKLADKRISCNPVSGCYHDHLFVPVAVVEDAIEVLTELAGDARAQVLEI